MARRGHSTTIGKFAKIHHDRRVSELRIFGEMLRNEQQHHFTPRPDAMPSHEGAKARCP